MSYKTAVVMGEIEMKIFVSWSGKLSKGIAEELKKWIPCIIQSAEVFYSPEDIEKGQNWNTRITEELSDCNYGIICLTSENKNAPWINFEAGAIAKALDSRVTALLIDINPSDIQGPLSSYQATQLSKQEFLKLFHSINKCQENPIADQVLETLFDAVWEKIDKKINQIIQGVSLPKKEAPKKADNTILLENILQMMRDQVRLLGNPSMLLPKEYLMEAFDGSKKNKNDLLDYVNALLNLITDIDRRTEENDYKFIKKEIMQILDISRLLLKNQGLEELENGRRVRLRIDTYQRRIQRAFDEVEKNDINEF